MWRLNPGLVVPSDAWVATVLHAAKSKLINFVLAQQAVPPSRTLRGNVNSKMADLLWVITSASTAAQPDQGAWRHCLVWLISIQQLRALPHGTSASDIWQAGSLHILVRAPRAQAGWRMTSAPPATNFGETIALALDYQGPVITTFMALRSSGSLSGGPVRATLQFDGPPDSDSPPPKTTLRKLFRPGFKLDLPLALQCIDAEQQHVAWWQCARLTIRASLLLSPVSKS